MIDKLIDYSNTTVYFWQDESADKEEDNISGAIHFSVIDKCGTEIKSGYHYALGYLTKDLEGCDWGYCVTYRIGQKPPHKIDKKPEPVPTAKFEVGQYVADKDRIRTVANFGIVSLAEFIPSAKEWRYFVKYDNGATYPQTPEHLLVACDHAPLFSIGEKVFAPMFSKKPVYEIVNRTYNLLGKYPEDYWQYMCRSVETGTVAPFVNGIFEGNLKHYDEPISALIQTPSNDIVKALRTLRSELLFATDAELCRTLAPISAALNRTITRLEEDR